MKLSGHTHGWRYLLQALLALTMPLVLVRPAHVNTSTRSLSPLTHSLGHSRTARPSQLSRRYKIGELPEDEKEAVKKAQAAAAESGGGGGRLVGPA